MIVAVVLLTTPRVFTPPKKSFDNFNRPKLVGHTTSAAITHDLTWGSDSEVGYEIRVREITKLTTGRPGC